MDPAVIGVVGTLGGTAAGGLISFFIARGARADAAARQQAQLDHESRLEQRADLRKIVDECLALSVGIFDKLIDFKILGDRSSDPPWDKLADMGDELMKMQVALHLYHSRVRARLPNSDPFAQALGKTAKAHHIAFKSRPQEDKPENYDEFCKLVDAFGAQMSVLEESARGHLT